MAPTTDPWGRGVVAGSYLAADALTVSRSLVNCLSVGLVLLSSRKYVEGNFNGQRGATISELEGDEDSQLNLESDR